MPTSTESVKEEWRELLAFLEKVLDTGVVTRTAAAMCSACLRNTGIPELCEMFNHYLAMQPRMSMCEQEDIIRRLVEAGEADSMLELVFNGTLSAMSINEMLESAHPLDYDDMVMDCLDAVQPGQIREVKRIKALDFTEQLLDSGIINWMTVFIVQGRFELHGLSYAAKFRRYEGQLPRQTADKLIKALEKMIEAECSDTLRRLVDFGMVQPDVLNETLVEVCSIPWDSLDYLQSNEWAAAIERRLAEDAAQGGRVHW